MTKAKPGMLPIGRQSKSMNNILSSTSTPSPSLRSLTRLGSLSSIPTSPAMSTSSSSSTTLSKSSSTSSKKMSAKAIEANANLYADIIEVRKAMDLFLNSRIPESEAILDVKKNTSIYHSLGYAFVLFLKACMTFQRSDIEAGIDAMKDAYQLADKFRKRDSSWKSISGWVKTHSIQDIKNMTPLQRHAVSDIYIYI